MKDTIRTTQRIVIDPAACKGCHLCIDQCPQQVLEASRTRNAKGYILPRAARPADCTGCQSCEMICPDLAITVEVSENAK